MTALCLLHQHCSWKPGKAVSASGHCPAVLMLRPGVLHFRLTTARTGSEGRVLRSWTPMKQNQTDLLNVLIHHSIKEFIQSVLSDFKLEWLPWCALGPQDRVIHGMCCFILKQSESPKVLFDLKIEWFTRSVDELFDFKIGWSLDVLFYSRQADVMKSFFLFKKD